MPDVILPVLDEAEALPWVLGRMPAHYSPVVVDNGSTDGSGDIARALGARVVPEPARGFGAACLAGLTAGGAEVVCFMDCDGSLDPIQRESRPVHATGQTRAPLTPPLTLVETGSSAAFAGASPPARGCAPRRSRRRRSRPTTSMPAC